MRFAFFFFAACVACNAIDGADQYKKVDSDAQSTCPSSCLTTSQNCLTSCASTRDQCLSSCGGNPNTPPCKACVSSYDTCTSACTSACQSCGTDCTLSLCTSDAGID